MKATDCLLYRVLFCLCYWFGLFGLGSPLIKGAPGESMWETVSALRVASVREAGPGGASLTVRLNRAVAEGLLAGAPPESEGPAKDSPVVVALPRPGGGFAQFRVVESPVLAPGLAAKFPEIRTYVGQGVDDPAATARFGLTEQGLHAVVLGTDGASFVEPLLTAVGGAVAEPDVYVSRRAGADGAGAGGECVVAGVREETWQALAAAGQPQRTNYAVGDFLRTYRLAVLATPEYTLANGGTVTSALAAIATIVNVGNTVLEKELCLRLELVDGAERTIFSGSSPLSKPVTNGDRYDQATLFQTILDRMIGSDNYDLGHCFFAGPGGGTAQIGALCDDSLKAQLVTGMLPPHGLSRDMWTYLHETGHMLGGGHTWNSASCSDISQYFPGSAWEPGSGTTIMSYYTCATGDTIQGYPDLNYHSGSFETIISTLFQSPNAPDCALRTPTGNHPPSVNAGPDYTIPKSTPFVLTARGTDVDGDALTYSWEQLDVGPQAELRAAPGATGPLFRVFPPSPSPTRVLPQLANLAAGVSSDAERLPIRARLMRWRTTVRDNRAGGGGVASDDTILTVASNAGPFVVTAPTGGEVWHGRQTVRWDVAGTDLAPVSAAAVNILLSTNGGFDFPITLAAGTPNDGEEAVELPEIHCLRARIKVEAAGNIFFAMSKADFTLPADGPHVVFKAVTIVEKSCQEDARAGRIVTAEVVLGNEGRGAYEGSSAAPSVVPGSPAGLEFRGPWLPILPGGTATNRVVFAVGADQPCGETVSAQMCLSDECESSVAFDLPTGRRRAMVQRFTQTNALAQPIGQLEGRPYPSFLLVSNVVGRLDRVTVTLSNLNGFLGNVTILLAGPDGQVVKLFSDLYESAAVSRVTLTLADEAAAALPTVPDPKTGTYRLADPFPKDVPLAWPAPEANAANFAAFRGTNPNGYWQLYIRRRGGTESGMSLGSWAIELTTTEPDCCQSSERLELSAPAAPTHVPIPGVPIEYEIQTVNLGRDLTDRPVLQMRGYWTPRGGSETVAFETAETLDRLPGGAIHNIPVRYVPAGPGELRAVASVASGLGEPFPKGDSLEVRTRVLFPAVSIQDGARFEGNTGTSIMIFKAALSEPASATVAFATADGTALAGVDYVATNLLAEFKPDQTLVELRVPLIVNRGHQPDRWFTLQRTGNAGGFEAAQGSATGLIVDDDPLPRISVSDRKITESDAGATNMIFNFSLHAPSTNTVSFEYATEPESATEGTDYQAQRGRVEFPPGIRAQSLTVPVTGDLVPEGEETFRLRLSNPVNATLYGSVALGTIIDNDTIRVTFSGGIETGLNLRFVASVGERYRVEWSEALGVTARWEAVANAGDIRATAGVVSIPVQISDEGKGERFFRVGRLVAGQ